jgi:mannitol 2-dehydrogenase
MDELTPLSLTNLKVISTTSRVPRYARADLSAGIVHIGLGNFHRAHQAWYLHRLFDNGLSHDWAIVGAGVRPADAAQRERLLEQDCLTTLIELDPSGKSAEVIGSMIDFVPVEDDNASLIARMAQADIRIVSLTVTEGGYYINPATGTFDASHPDITHDIARPETPKTAFGAIIAALRERRKKRIGPFTCMSCDNLQSNGAILKRTVLEMAQLMDSDLAAWIEAECSFPNSMVDCIVPATGPAELAMARSFSLQDASPVTHENFRQWVIEDTFCAGRPHWENVGITFTDNVDQFEAMKLRILNGGHQIIAMPGELLGLATIDEAMADPAIAAFLAKVVRDEVTPHVAAVPGMLPMDYFAVVAARFSNPEIRDTTRRVAFDGSARQPGFLIPSIRDGLKAGTPVEGLALAAALWCRYCEGSREDGTGVEPNDPNWASLKQAALLARDDPHHWLAQRQYYGDLADHPTFANAFAGWLQTILRHGVRGALHRYLSGPRRSSDVTVSSKKLASS